MKLYIALGFPVALAACGTMTEPIPGEILAPAATPDAQVRHAVTPALLSGYAERPVTGPASWRELNDQQSPNQGGS